MFNGFITSVQRPLNATVMNATAIYGKSNLKHGFYLICVLMSVYQNAHGSRQMFSAKLFNKLHLQISNGIFINF